MTNDHDVPQQATEPSTGASKEVTDVMQAEVSDMAASLEASTGVVAEQAEASNQESAKAASSALDATADAFGAARERLNAMSATLPDPAQDVLRPFQSGGEAFGKGLQASYATTLQGMAEFNSKAIAAWRSNAEATIRHWQNLAAVRSLSDAIALSTEHTRQQLEAVTAQTRELSGLATRIVRDAADPLKITGR